MPSPTGKENQRFHKAHKQTEVRSASEYSDRSVLTLDMIKHSAPTPEDDMARQVITGCGDFTLDLMQLVPDKSKSSFKYFEIKVQGSDRRVEVHRLLPDLTLIDPF